MRYTRLSAVAVLAVCWRAGVAPAAGPADIGAAKSAPADLRGMDGQVVQIDPAKAGNAGLSSRELHWKYAEVELEWGFKEGTGGLAFDGTIESTHVLGMVGKARPLPGDNATTMTGDRAWKSLGSAASRRGIVVPLLFTNAVRGPGRTIVTVRTSSGSFSFQPIDLRFGPILVGELGFFIRDLSPRRAQPPASRPSQAPPPGDLMNGKLDAIGGFPAVKGWGYKDTPVVCANPGPEPAAVIPKAVTIPPRTVAVHPGPDRDVAVAWRSPVACKVSVLAKVVHGHPSGGDGITWSIVHEGPAGRKVLAEGAIDRGGSQSIPVAADAGKLADLAVQKGDSLSLVIGRRGDYTCDTTLIELTIAEGEGPGRTWDLVPFPVRGFRECNCLGYMRLHLAKE